MKKMKRSMKAITEAAFAMALLAAMFLCGCTGANDNSNIDVNQNTDSDANQSGSSENNMSYEQITQEKAWELINSENNYIILDVRTLAEYEEKHIPGAINYPVEDISDKDIPVLPDKKQLILIYCRSGNRSKQAANKLVAMGYSNIKEFGGINTWQYDTVTGK